MRIKSNGYFLLDAVLATLILSILLSVVLFSLQTSIRGFRKINEYLYGLYLGESILYKKFLLLDKLENEGSQVTPYGEFNWTVSEEELEEELKKNLSKFVIIVEKEGKIYSDISSFILRK